MPEPSKLAELEAVRQMLERSIDAAELRIASVRCPAPERQPFKAAEPAPLPPEVDLGRRVVPQDIASLEGCWDLASDYRTQSVQVRSVFYYYSEWVMCFDEGGVGTSTMIGQRGDSSGPDLNAPHRDCVGTSKASFDATGNLVIIEDDDMTCNEGGGPFRRELLCQLDNTGGAVCDIIQPESPDHYRGRPSESGTLFRAQD